MFVDYLEYDAFKVTPSLTQDSIKIYTWPLNKRDVVSFNPS